MRLKAETEATTQRAVIDYLAAIGAVVVRVNSGGMKVEKRFVRFNDTPGCSDVLACLPTLGGGKFLAVECKKPTWKAAPPTSRDVRRLVREAEQRAFLDRVNRAGGLGVFVRSVSELEAALKAEGLL